MRSKRLPLLAGGPNSAWRCADREDHENKNHSGLLFFESVVYGDPVRHYCRTPGRGDFPNEWHDCHRSSSSLKRVPQLLLGRAFFAHELCLGVTHVSQRTLKKTRGCERQTDPTREIWQFRKTKCGCFCPQRAKTKSLKGFCRTRLFEMAKFQCEYVLGRTKPNCPGRLIKKPRRDEKKRGLKK